MRLTKHHGLGNDFWVALVDELPDDAPGLARELCHRTRGLGADGLIIGLPGDLGADTNVTMVLFNADGSRAEMSGNGIRCLAQAKFQQAGLGAADYNAVLRIGTDAGVRTVSLESTDNPAEIQARVDMGPIGPGPELDEVEKVNIYLEDNVLEYWGFFAAVEVGNPHLVVAVERLDQVPVTEHGAELSRLAGGINVEFFCPGDGGRVLHMRVWERGVGETQACGTGACAAAFVAHQWEECQQTVVVSMPGGDVTVDLADTAVLSGPATFITAIDYG